MINNLPSYVAQAVMKSKQTTDEFPPFEYPKSSGHPEMGGGPEFQKMLDREIELLNQPTFVDKANKVIKEMKQ